MLTRRRLLVGAGGLSISLLAGCLEDADTPAETPIESPTSTPTPSPTPSPTPTPTPDETQKYTVDHPSLPHDRAIELVVDLLQPEVGDPTGPVTLEVTLTNETDDRIGYRPPEHVFFWGSEAEGFVLYPMEIYEDEAYDEDTKRWIAQETLAFNPSLETTYLAAGESESETLFLLAKSDQDLPNDHPTELTFEQTFEVGMAPPDDSEQLETMDWSFTLSLEP